MDKRETKIIVKIENVPDGLFVACGSSTGAVNFKSWEKIFNESEKRKALQNVKFIKEEWESKGAQVLIDCRGLTGEEVRIIEEQAK